MKSSAFTPLQFALRDEQQSRNFKDNLRFVRLWHARCACRWSQTRAVRSGDSARANKKIIREGIMNVPIQMTLGELIVAVTDEVGHSTGNGDTTNWVVAQILNRLFSEGTVRFTRRPASSAA
jgi:hypothetical protein